jgi:hypothetical protein
MGVQIPAYQPGLRNQLLVAEHHDIKIAVVPERGTNKEFDCVASGERPGKWRTSKEPESSSKVKRVPVIKGKRHRRFTSPHNAEEESCHCKLHHDVLDTYGTLVVAG